MVGRLPTQPREYHKERTLHEGQVNPERVLAWMTEARRHARLANLIVSQSNNDFTTSTIVEIQQAAEFAAKALLLACGLPYTDVRRMGHETVAVFLKLVISVIEGVPDLKIWQERSMVDSARYGPEIIKKLDLYRLGDRRAREEKRRLLAQWNSHFPRQDFLKGERPEIENWNRDVRAWSAEIIDAFLDLPDTMHAELQEMFFNRIPENLEVDPQSILSGGRMSRLVYDTIVPHVDSRYRSYDQLLDSNSIIRHLDQAAVNWIQLHSNDRIYPIHLNVRQLVTDHFLGARAFMQLLLVGAITAPHYLTARYPTEHANPELDMEPLMYDDSVGIVRTLPRLATNVEQAIKVLSDGRLAT